MKSQSQFEQILKNPAAVYQSPREVLNDKRLNRQQRVAILQSWEQDERELQVAQEEGMMGDQTSILDDILAALNELSIDAKNHDAPTKQGGTIG